MKNTIWIPEVNEIVSWGCDIARVMKVNFAGKCSIKLEHNKKIVRDIDISQLETFNH